MANEITPKNGLIVRLSTSREPENFDYTQHLAAYYGALRETAHINFPYQVNLLTRARGILAHRDIKALRKASPEEKHEIVAEEIIKKDRLDPSYKLARRPWDDLGGNLIGMSTRVLGKQFLAENDGKYSVNEGLLKEAYSHTDALKSMAFQYKNAEA